MDEFRRVFVIVIVKTGRALSLRHVLVEDTWTRWHAWGALHCRWCWWTVFFKLLKFLENFVKLLLSLVLLFSTLNHCDRALAVNEVWCSRSSARFALNPVPVLFEILLDQLQPIQSWHLLLAAGSRLTRVFRTTILLLTARVVGRVLVGDLIIWIVSRLCTTCGALARIVTFPRGASRLFARARHFISLPIDTRLLLMPRYICKQIRFVSLQESQKTTYVQTALCSSLVVMTHPQMFQFLLPLTSTIVAHSNVFQTCVCRAYLVNRVVRSLLLTFGRRWVVVHFS